MNGNFFLSVLYSHSDENIFMNCHSLSLVHKYLLNYLIKFNGTRNDCLKQRFFYLFSLKLRRKNTLINRVIAVFPQGAKYFYDEQKQYRTQFYNQSFDSIILISTTFIRTLQTFSIESCHD